VGVQRIFARSLNEGFIGWFSMSLLFSSVLS